MEERQCNICGEIWMDTGDDQCPFCGSDDTFIIEEDDLPRQDIDD